MAGELIATQAAPAEFRTLAVIPGDASVLKDDIERIAGGLMNLQVKNRPQFLDAAEHLRGIKSFQKRLEELRTSVTGPLNQALRTVNDWFRGPAEALDKAERVIKRAMGEFERLERERVEQERLAAERKAREEREELARRAEKAQARGNEAKAAELTARAAAVVAALPETAPVKAAGMGFGEEWVYTVTDEAIVPDEYWVLDHAKIRGVVNTMKAKTAIPGVSVSSRPRVSARVK